MKQFIVDRHTAPSTPTLDEVPTEKIPIYDSISDAEDDLANLAVGQLVGTKDDGADELLKVVDTVEDNNMHPVTSNAVAEYFYPDTTIIESTVKRTVSVTAGTATWYATQLEKPTIPSNKRLIRYFPKCNTNTVALVRGDYTSSLGQQLDCIIIIPDMTGSIDIWWAAEVADK